jgi:hypothetical protein
MRAAALAALATLLPACAPGMGAYDKPGIPYAQWRRDHDECRLAALRADGGVDRAALDRCMRERGYAGRRQDRPPEGTRY